MNRIIIIGNGFDLAHNLKTGYKDFIDAYWYSFSEKVFSAYSQQINRSFGIMHPLNHHEDDFASIEKEGAEFTKEFLNELGDSPFAGLCSLITKHNSSKENMAVFLKFKNEFFGHISNHCSLTNWVDIENEYYDALKKLSLAGNVQKRNEKVKKLNGEFNAVKKSLKEYLDKTSKKTVNPHTSIMKAVKSLIDLNDVAIRKQGQYLDSIIDELERTINDLGFFEDIKADPSYSFYSHQEACRIHLKKKLENDYFKKINCKPSLTVFFKF